jgi:hypothetical protein
VLPLIELDLGKAGMEEYVALDAQFMADAEPEVMEEEATTPLQAG